MVRCVAAANALGRVRLYCLECFRAWSASALILIELHDTVVEYAPLGVGERLRLCPVPRKGMA